MKLITNIIAMGAAVFMSAGVSAESITEQDLAKGVTEIIEVKAVQPEYPVDALYRGREGSVLLSYNLDTNGVPKDIKVVSVDGSKVFVPASLRALKNTRFEAARVNGEVVAVQGVKRRYSYILRESDGRLVASTSLASL